MMIKRKVLTIVLISIGSTVFFHPNRALGNDSGSSNAIIDFVPTPRPPSDIAREEAQEKAYQKAHEYETLEWSGYSSNQEKEFIKVVTTKEEWDALWKRALAKPAPEMDFQNYAVACVFLGNSARWLYDIGFDKPLPRDNRLVVTYSLLEVKLELTGPFEAKGQYHMKVFKKTKGSEMSLEKRPEGL